MAILDCKDKKINIEEYEKILSRKINLEFIEAKLAVSGYKSYSYETTISFLKQSKEFDNYEIQFIDNLRIIRSGIKYYGNESKKEESETVTKFLKSIFHKLRRLTNEDK